MTKRSFRETFNRFTACFTIEIFLLVSLFPGNAYADDETGRVPVVPIAADDAVPTNDSSVMSSSYETVMVYGTRGTVVPDRNTIIVDGGVSIAVPAGAVSAETEIVIERLDAVSALNPGMVNMTGGSAGYRLLPDGMKFAKNISITLPYDKSAVSEESAAQNITTYFYNEATGYWEKLFRVGVDLDKGTVTSLSNHFTDLVNSTLKLPETPKLLDYNPNSIKDIKAADPGTGITTIDPPKPNRQGSANMSFPIEVPAGRNGMEPRLALGYSSSGGNGWCGVGWSCGVSQITVDTRWGVPYYKLDVESETYMLDGEQLAPVAFAAGWVSRSTDRRFYPRVEGSFRRIIRRGTGPANYFWEVTTKDGRRSYYGGLPGSGLDEGSILGTNGPNGNIYRWALTMEQDPNGNTVRYHYRHTGDAGSGYQLYLWKVTYTGYGNEEGAYAVEFVTDAESGESARTDAAIDCRGGFVARTEELLRHIRVTYAGAPVRSYELVYVKGAFERTLLSAVVVNGADGSEFYRTGFEYYDEVRTNGEYAGFESTGRSIDTGTDNVDSLLSQFPLGSDLLQPSVLGTTDTGGFNGHLYVGVKPGIDMSKTNSGGVKAGAGYSSTEGTSSFIDLNGDGLPDKVFREAGNFYFRPQGKNGTFGTKVALPTLRKISLDESTNVTAGGEWYPVGGNMMADYTWTFSTGKVYFSDVNGDGLADLVDDGIVFFNRLENGVPTFRETSEGTPLAITAGKLDSNLLADLEETMKKREASAPLMDCVKSWEAPYTGTVNISGDITYKTVPIDEYKYADGLSVGIEYNGNTLFGHTFAPSANLADQTVPANIQTLNVTRGKCVYFRVQSIHDGAYDAVEWDPVIEYLDKPLDLADENGKTVYRYVASEDFVYAGRPGQVYMPISGTVRVSGEFVKHDILSDDLRIIINKLSRGTSSDIIDNKYSQVIDWADTNSINTDVTFKVQRDDQLEFRIEADSRTDVSAVRWTPHVEYVSADDQNVPVTDDHGNPTIVFEPYYDMDVYPDSTNTNPETRTFTASKSGKLRVVPVFTIDPLLLPVDPERLAAVNGRTTLTAKRQKELLGKCSLDVAAGTAGVFGPLPMTMDVLAGDALYFDFNTREPELRKYLRSAAAYYAWEGYTPTKVSLSHTTWKAGQNGRIYVDGVLTVKRNPGTAANSVVIDVLSDTTRIGGTTIEVPYDKNVPRDIPFGFGFNAVAGTTYSFRFNPGLLGSGDLAFDIECRSASASGAIVDNLEDFTAAPSSFMSARFPNLKAQEYRGWACFGYNGDEDRKDKPIIQGLLQIGEDYGELDDKNKPKPRYVYVFYPSLTMKQWKSEDENCWVSSAEMSSSRNGEDHIGLPETGASGAIAVGVPRMSSGGQFTEGGSVGPVSASVAIGGSAGYLDYMDMNGDRYPDVITSSGIQYTVPTGGLAEKLSGFSGNARSSNNTAISYGQSVPIMSPDGRGIVNGTIKGGVFDSMPITVSLDVSMDPGFSDTQYDLIDINGDGLPDRLEKTADGISVKYNTGYGFSAPQMWTGGEISGGTNLKFPVGLSLGFYTGYYSFGGGLNFGGNYSLVNKSLVDVNGDGLVDYTYVTGSGFAVRFNTGSGFTEPVAWSTVNGVITRSESQTGSGGVYFTIPIYIPIPFTPGITILINPGANVSYSYGKQATGVRDADGDGLPDVVTSSGGRLSVKSNRTGRTNLLRKVTLPLGGSYELGYEREGNTYDQPTSAWVLTRIVTNDGHAGDGEDRKVKSVTYADGKYDRKERESYGYETVIENTLSKTGAVYVRNVKTYRVDRYYAKGLLVSDETFDGRNRLLASTKNRYSFHDVLGDRPFNENEAYTSALVIFPRLVESVSERYENGSGSPLRSTVTFGYDRYGNIVSSVDGGDDSVTDDDVHIAIGYTDDVDRWIVGKPVMLEVTDRMGTPLRKRSGSYDTKGNLTGIESYESVGDDPSHTFGYDRYGNIVSVRDPKGYTITYAYDDAVHTYPVMISDSFGLSSRASYDYRYGTPTITTDTNESQIRYEYDAYGRTVRVFGPYDTTEPCLRMEYHHAERPARAVTRNKVHFDPANTDALTTVTFADGLGRGVQTKKTGVVYRNGTYVRGMNVSGLALYDEFGRIVSEGQMVFESGVTGIGGEGFYRQTTPLNPTRIAYDERSRTVTTTLADGSEMAIAYAIEGGRAKETTIDPLGKKKVIWKDIDENIVRVDQYNGIKTLSTRYEYSLLDEIVSVTDAAGYVTRIGYDTLGRRTRIESPDAGTIEYVYDLAGNLVKKIDDNLRTMIRGIEYGYEYNRLVSVRYPKKETITYTYGKSNASAGERGKLLAVAGDFGSTHYAYGKLGEAVRIEKRIKRELAVFGEKSFVFEYGYDYLGRTERMTYPDGETVNYSYDAGGQIARITGRHRDADFTYVDNVGYDEFGQRVYIRYGNGVETTYTYDPARRWLAGLNTRNSERVFQQTTYGFDRVGNVLSIANASENRTIKQTYGYDDLYQLTSARGTYRDTRIQNVTVTNDYTQSFSFDGIGRMTAKTSVGNVAPDKAKGKALTYDLAYAYDLDHPHRATEIGDFEYEYDPNGNLTEAKQKNLGKIGIGTMDIPIDRPEPTMPDDVPPNTGFAAEAFGYDDRDMQSASGTQSMKSTYVWDEENRMVASTVNGLAASYRYDAGGARVLKVSVNSETMYPDTTYQQAVSANPPVITKHIFLGSTRVVSKLSHETSYPDLGFEQMNAYTYHGDHLGSSNWVTDWKGNEYEHFEYTPYGEGWVTEEPDQLRKIEYRFTGKELDEETGLYYYGARYLDPKTSRWMSADPALGDYMPVAPVSDDAKKRNQNLPGIGGVFNAVNLAVYHYAGNNPIKYTDPDGEAFMEHDWYNVFCFSWDDIQKIYYATPDQFQKNIAYYDLWDFFASPLVQARPFRFTTTNPDGTTKHWKIELWKGNYAAYGAGGEIGIYTGGLLSPDSKCGVNDQMQMSFELFDTRTGRRLFHRDQFTWWITGFKPGEDAGKSDLQMRGTITFTDINIANAFFDVLGKDTDKTGISDIQRSEDGLTISFTWD